jgi:predicted GH43/DUF377 family glycosyl hydrolase
MYYSANNGLVSAIGLATSTDGIHWTKRPNPVLETVSGSWHAKETCFPNVYFDGNKYYMWYTGATDLGPSSIGLATSTDGIEWTNDVNNPVLTGTPSAWDSKNLGAPFVVKVGNTFYMFYDADNTGVCCTLSIGYATSTDGIHWVKSTDNPILTPIPNTWEDASLANMCVLYMNDTLKMWYSAAHYGPWQTGYAYSVLGSVHNDSLVAYWKFDDSTVAVAVDSSEYHNDGTNYGTTLVPGVIGTARHFNGTSDFINVPSSSNLQFDSSQSFTISAWFKTTQMGVMEIVRKGSAPTPGYMLRLYDGHVEATIGDDAGLSSPYGLVHISSDSPYNNGEWHHALFSRNRSDHKLYLVVDGKLATDPVVDTYAFGLVNTRPLNIGRWDALGGVEHYSGDLDEIKIQIGVHLSYSDSNVTPGAKIALTVGHTHAFKNDTVSVAVHADFPIGKSYSAYQVTLSGFEHQGLTLLDLDTAGTLTGSNGWSYQFNNADSSLFIASAGAQDISGGGVLFNLKFLVDGDPIKTVPVNITSSLFNTGADSVIWTNGGVDILQPMLGDVDLNGVVQAYDASLVLKHLVGLDTLDHCQLFNADVTGDASVSAADARSILRYVVGLIPAFPDTSVQGLTPSGTIYLSPIHAQTGDIISFAVNLDGSQNVISSEGLLKYDKTILQYVGTGSSDLLDSFVTNNTPGEIRFAGYKNTAADQSGKLMVVKFKVLGLSGTTKILLSKLRLNEGRVLDDIGSSDVVLGVDDHSASLPVQYALQQNYPNPFNPTTMISFSIPHDSHVILKIYNVLGEEVATLVNDQKTAGDYSVVWNASTVPSGIYWYRLLSDDFSATRQMVLVK